MAASVAMKKRCWLHDYCAPSFYMVTIITEPRRDCLSKLVAEAAPADSVAGAAQAPPSYKRREETR